MARSADKPSLDGLGTFRFQCNCARQAPSATNSSASTCRWTRFRPRRLIRAPAGAARPSRRRGDQPPSILNSRLNATGARAELVFVILRIIVNALRFPAQAALLTRRTRAGSSASSRSSARYSDPLHAAGSAPAGHFQRRLDCRPAGNSFRVRGCRPIRRPAATQPRDAATSARQWPESRDAPAPRG